MLLDASRIRVSVRVQLLRTGRKGANALALSIDIEKMRLCAASLRRISVTDCEETEEPCLKFVVWHS
jgi:hypothetical protein